MAVIACPHCKEELEATGTQAGKTVRCPDCKGFFAVPAWVAEPPPIPPEPDPEPEEDFFQGMSRPAASMVEAAKPEPPMPKAKKEPARTTHSQTVVVNVTQGRSGGFGPVVIEILLTLFTGGVLGGCGSVAAGKGPGRVFVSLGVAIFCFLGTVFSGGLLVFLLAPFWMIFVLVKFAMDLFACAS